MLRKFINYELKGLQKIGLRLFARKKITDPLSLIKTLKTKSKSQYIARPSQEDLEYKMRINQA